MAHLPQRALTLVRQVGSTYWFLPALLTTGAVMLSLFLTALDRTGADKDLWLGWAYGGGADGARALLSAVAGSMVTVVSVTFSVMIVALTVSSQHFGPRLLRSFMRDRAAQIVLGTFTGTFAYCLMVLRTVQGDDGAGYAPFVPELGVAGAVVLVLVAVSALIYYVHHISVSMQVSDITRRIAGELNEAIDSLYPDPLGSAAEPAPGAPPVAPADATHVRAPTTGYVQTVNDERLFGLGKSGNATVWLHANPGDFVAKGDVLAAVYPGGPKGRAKAVAESYVIGPERSASMPRFSPTRRGSTAALTR